MTKVKPGAFRRAVADAARSLRPESDRAAAPVAALTRREGMFPGRHHLVPLGAVRLDLSVCARLQEVYQFRRCSGDGGRGQSQLVRIQKNPRRWAGGNATDEGCADSTAVQSAQYSSASEVEQRHGFTSKFPEDQGLSDVRLAGELAELWLAPRSELVDLACAKADIGFKGDIFVPVCRFLRPPSTHIFR